MMSGLRRLARSDAYAKTQRGLTMCASSRGVQRFFIPARGGEA